MKLRVTLLVFLVATAALSARQFLSRVPARPPAPTEHRLDADAEERNREDRRAWLAEMHRTAPGVDWRALERANGRDLQARRNAAVRDGHDDRWTEIGSRNLAGRMHVAAVSVVGDSLYGGSSRGGVWKGSLHGDGWRPLADDLWGGSHGLAVAGADGEVITSITDGGGVHYSEDGGATWLVPAGLPQSLGSCKRVARDPTDPDRVLLMARFGGALVLYLSDDAGRSYQQVRSLSGTSGDFWLDRVQGGTVYVLDGNRLWSSQGSLLVWTPLGTLPFGQSTGTVLTASEAGAPTFYAAAQLGGEWRLYRSLDGGLTWMFRHAIDDFWETLCASITDPDLVAFAGVELWRSTDGGGSFAKVNDWWEYYDDPVHKLHADFPGLDCLPRPGGGEVWYAATDGGLYRSDDGLASVANISLEGLGVSQYYSTLTSANDPELVLAGAQDQGYQRSTGPGRGPAWDFTQLISGDYGHLTSSDGTHAVVFSVYPGFVLVQQGEQAPVLAGYLDFPADDHGWLPFILADPDDAHAFYFCGTRLHHGVWRGGDIVTYTASSQDFTVAGGSYLTAVGIAPADHGRRIAVVDNGRIWSTTDGGAQWRLSADTGPAAHYFYGTAIVHAAGDPDRAWIGGSGYSGPGVWRTDDGGQTWEAAGEGLPATLVYGLALESPDREILYAATEAGPYRLDPGTGPWEAIGGTTAPLTTYWCVEAVPTADLVRFGTYGRGIWDYAVTPATGVEDDLPVATTLELACAPNPFNPRTTLRFTLPRASRVELAVYTVRGERVRTLVAMDLTAGEHEVAFDGTGLPSGTYLARLSASGVEATRRLTLVR